MKDLMRSFTVLRETDRMLCHVWVDGGTKCTDQEFRDIKVARSRGGSHTSIRDYVAAAEAHLREQHPKEWSRTLYVELPEPDDDGKFRIPEHSDSFYAEPNESYLTVSDDLSYSVGPIDYYRAKALALLAACEEAERQAAHVRDPRAGESLDPEVQAGPDDQSGQRTE